MCCLGQIHNTVVVLTAAPAPRCKQCAFQCYPSVRCGIIPVRGSKEINKWTSNKNSSAWNGNVDSIKRKKKKKEKLFTPCRAFVG